MKVTLVSVNAKYVHTGLAGRYLSELGSELSEHEIDHQEYSINQPIAGIVSELLRNPSKAYGFSAYIWNLNEILQVCRQIKKINPEIILFLGGPEVSYEEEILMEKEPCIDLIVRGEGENVLLKLLEIKFQPMKYAQVPSLTYRKEMKIIKNPLGEPTPMKSLPFAYSDKDMHEPGKIFYYESSRGCPYSCAFCLSAQDGNRVRYRPLEQVTAHMAIFLSQKVKQVKFIDRTFNADPDRAMALLDFLEEKHNGITNFHFECSPDRLTPVFIERLATLPEGMVQLEIGIQSTNPETSRAIHRPREIDLYRRVIEQLRRPDNIHLHVDLIAGLPFEDYSSFRESFNDVFSLDAHVIQLGFLKLLKGSELRMRNEEYKLICSEDPPYEVLKTPWLSYKDVQHLKWIEDLVDKYNNSQGFIMSLPFALDQFNSPFDFFEKFTEYWVGLDLHLRKHRSGALYSILLDFSQKWDLTEEARKEWEERLLFDSLYANGEPFCKDHSATKMKRSQKNALAELFLEKQMLFEGNLRKKRYPDVAIARFETLGKVIKPGNHKKISLIFFKKRRPLFVQPCELYQLKEEKDNVQFNRLAIRL
ncbi:B12-binding domain-containing radical SAM protein [Gottschalkiaceae bacterium SANA]|nr:B12-binding domain-containing radical SAM protein [Gottschalkiaceae bacterium SANA]